MGWREHGIWEDIEGYKDGRVLGKILAPLLWSFNLLHCITSGPGHVDLQRTNSRAGAPPVFLAYSACYFDISQLCSLKHVSKFRAIFS